jgi:hypothetical protein
MSEAAWVHEDQATLKSPEDQIYAANVVRPGMRYFFAIHQ